MKLFRLLVTGFAFVSTAALAEEGFYQYPSVHDDVMVFASEGDLWRTSRDGGTAVRLTNHAAEESDPHISPDGTMVAFTAGYDSTADVYVMPVGGGAPQRLTFEGGFIRSVGWTPDGKVVFSSRLPGGGQGTVLYTVATGGGSPVPIPLWRVNDATWSQDGKTLIFSRRGLALDSRDHAVLYRGGAMEQLWTWQGGKAEATQLLPDFGAPIRMPMADAGRIYFISDKSGADAVWSVNEDGSGLAQLSGELPFPVLQASADGGEIFLQNGADILVFSPTGGTLRKLAIDIVTDREQTRLRSIADPLGQMSSARISPSGKTVAVTARGRVAIGAPGQLRRVELAVPLDARARNAVESPDGKQVFVVIDRDLRGDIFRMPADGTGTPVAVTRGYDKYIWSFAVAPDGKTIVLWDKAARLQKVDVASGRVTLLATNATGSDNPYTGLTFSPDGKTIAYAQEVLENNSNTSDIWVQDLASGRRVRGTSGKFDDLAPAFAEDGRWLYFLSNRNFEPTPGHPWGDRNMGVGFSDRGEIYALQLDPAAEFPFREDNELTRAGNEEDEAASGKEDKDKKDDEEEKDKPVRIVFDGLADRLYKVPAKPGVSDILLATKGFLYSVRDEDIVSIAIDKSDAKEEVFAADVSQIDLSADRETLLVVAGTDAKPTLALVPVGAKMPEEIDNQTVRLADWRLRIDPKAEWQQMFVDAWRMHRDFAFDPKLRGVDWNAVRAEHEPLVARIGARSELNAILGQMASRLGILHSQVLRGDLPGDSENSEMAFLGATYSPVAGGLRIDSIYRAEADLVALRPPLRRPGVDVREGDIIRRIDGRPVASLGDLRSALASKVGQQVRLDLGRKGADTSAIVEPMTLMGEYKAAYGDFVERKRAATDSLSDGKIGYLHLNAMGPDDLASFARDWFPLLDKPGIVIDVRGNNGGSIDSLLISILQRRAWGFWSTPTQPGQPITNMQNAYRGHLAVLIDERTYSDGETFAAAIKSLGLAPLIGKSTAGAGIWLTDRNRLTDEGGVRVAELAQYSADGTWIIEGRGVGPDYEVENMPHATFEGQDAQLEAAVSLLQDEIARNPILPLKPQTLPALGTSAAEVTRLQGQ